MRALILTAGLVAYAAAARAQNLLPFSGDWFSKQVYSTTILPNNGIITIMRLPSGKIEVIRGEEPVPRLAPAARVSDLALKPAKDLIAQRVRPKQRKSPRRALRQLEDVKTKKRWR